MAFDGATGDTLWHIGSVDQIYTSPTFLDVTSDGVDDVFMGGRSAELKAINGATGELIWEFFPTGGSVLPADSGLYNFYGCQVIPDQNGDQIADLIIANGGDASAQPGDTNRPPGNLMIISALDGGELARAPMPDDAETYCTPVVAKFGDDTLRVVYGSGGETLPGSLWRCKLSDVMSEDLSGSERLDSSLTNGYVAPPSLVDLSGDGIFDVVANNYDDRLVAINGANSQMIWEKIIPDAESNVNPTIGYFNTDQVPDIHTTVALGEWITYYLYIRYTIDGSNGEVIDSTLYSWMNFSSSTCMDVNNDGFDEVLTATTLKHYSNQLNQDVFDARFTLEDKVGQEILFDTIIPGTAMVSTPIIDDVDNDGLVDVILSYSSDSVNPFSINGLVMLRVELPYSVPEYPSWTSYHGTFGNGHFGEPQILVATEEIIDFNSESSSFSNWIRHTQTMDWRIGIYSVTGQAVNSETYDLKSALRRIENLSAGIYAIVATNARSTESVRFKVLGGSMFLNP
jgi:outer membrane protein assembly factor BamB